MDSFRFSDSLDSEPVVALGLTAPRLGLAGIGAAAAWALTDLPGPAPVRLGAAGLMALISSTLAWGRFQGVSLARWSWLAIRYAGRALQRDVGTRRQWVDADSGWAADSQTEIFEPSASGVAFVSLQPGIGCSSVCRAVGAHLEAEAENAGPNLILYDWGSRPGAERREARVTILVLVWDGIEVYPGQLADEISALRCAYRLASLLVALNRAGPATHLGSLIAATGARLVCAIPTDPRLGAPTQSPMEALSRPSADGVRALARSVLAASKSW
jgi:hypothetical protein